MKRCSWIPFLVLALLFFSPTTQAGGGGGAFSLSYPDFYKQGFDYCSKQVRVYFKQECDAGIQFCLNQLFACVKNPDNSCDIQNVNGENDIFCLKPPTDCEEPSALQASMVQYKQEHEKDLCHSLTVALSIQQPGCGNGVVEPNEFCDDGNLKDGDTCPKDCQPPVVNLCGNGTLDPGEECDAGPENGKGESGCDLHCKSITFVSPISATGTTAPPPSGATTTPTTSAPPASSSPASSGCSLQVGGNSLDSISWIFFFSAGIFLVMRKKRSLASPPRNFPNPKYR
jgi:cysteine-rich repeat protein